MAYEYDALGRRITTVDYTADRGNPCGTGGTSVTTRHVYSGLEPVEEYVNCGTPAAPNWVLAREFVWGGSFPEPIALIDHTALGDKTASTPEVLHYVRDELGNVVGLTNAGDPNASPAVPAKLVERYDYDPYGRTYIEDPNTGTRRTVSRYGNPFAWTSQRYDAGVRMYGFFARTYSPELGRWLQRDPLGYVDGVNLYQYAQSAPTNLTDPLGLTSVSSPGGWGWGDGSGGDSGGDPPPFAHVCGNGGGDGGDDGGILIEWAPPWLVPAPPPEPPAGGIYTSGTRGTFDTPNVSFFEHTGTAGFDDAMDAIRRYRNGPSENGRQVSERLLRGALRATGGEGYVPVIDYGPAHDAVMRIVEIVQWLDFGVALARHGICFAEGTVVLTTDGLEPIENIHVGQRVLTSADDECEASAGHTDGTHSASWTEVDPAEYRLVRLLIPGTDDAEGDSELEALRPKRWLESAGVRAGAWLTLTLSDTGTTRAYVESVEPCPAIESGPGRVVVATTIRNGARVLRLWLDGLSEPLEPTAGHPFYSEDRRTWVPAGALDVGEHVRTLHGPAVVLRVEQKPGRQRVRNLEVEGTHQYLVTARGVVTHNMCAAIGLTDFIMSGKWRGLGRGIGGTVRWMLGFGVREGEAFVTRGMGGRILTAAERAEFEAFAARARASGLIENPRRTGSWGRYNADGDFVEVGRIDVGDAGRPGWRGKTHVHVGGGKEHLDPTTPLP